MTMPVILAVYLAASGFIGLGANVQDKQGREQEGRTCLAPEQITAVFEEKGMIVLRLSGKELDAFNTNYAKEFQVPKPSGMSLLLFVERGEFTYIFSFTDGCMNGQGRANTELVHRLLSGG